MIRTVLFDLDGTILDTNELIIQSFLHTFEGVTPQPLTREQIIPNMGRPLLEQIIHFSGRDEVDDLLVKYRKFNLSRHDELVKEFPYVRETIAKLHHSGIKLGVVTSKIRKTAEMGLKLTGMYDYFDTLITVEDVSRAKPDPEGIYKALEHVGRGDSSAIMVGDSHYDLEAARRAGIPSIAVAWSVKGVDYLKQHQPTYLIDDIRELLPIAGIQEGQN